MRLPQWRRELQVLAGELGLTMTAGHLLPGTSKWNKIERRLFSFIIRNWPSKSVVGHQTIVQPIAVTTTCTGLNVKCESYNASYPAGVMVSCDDIVAINITPRQFHGVWHYTIAPRPP